MKTTFEWDDYKDKMNKLANAHEAMAIYKLNLKFTHELLKETNENNFAYFLRDYPDLLAKKWREYEGLN